MERSRLQVPQSADVFSLGCILSEVVTWVTAGPPQLCEYRRRRSEEAYSISRQTKEALFHWKNRILDTVVQTHQQMLHNSRKNDDVTSNVIHRLIKGMLITDIHARAQASYFLTVGSNILNEAHEALRRVPSGERAPSGVHAASDGIVTVGKRRLPPSLPPNYHHRSLVDPIKVEPSNPNLEGATAQSSSSRSCRQNIPEMLPRHSMPPTSNEEPTEAPLKRWESMSAGSVEGIYLPPNSLVRRPDQTMAQPISPNSAPRHQGRPATSILAQRNPSSMRSGDGHTSKDGYLPATSNLAEESNDMIQWHLSRASTVERTSHSPDVRSFDSSLNNEISALGSVFDASVPVLNSRSSNEPTQNDRPHPYMSVDDGLNVKRERDRGKDSKYPGWDEMKTMDYILRGRDYVSLSSFLHNLLILIRKQLELTSCRPC